MIKFGSNKKYSLIFLEAIIVALAMAVMAIFVKNVYKTENYIEIAAITGFLLHIIFEYTYVNEMYSVYYCELLQKV